MIEIRRIDILKLPRASRSMVFSRTGWFTNTSTVVHSNKGELRVGTIRMFLDGNNEDSLVMATWWWLTFAE